MAFPLPTVIPLGSESRVSDPQLYSGVHAIHHNNDTRSSRDRRYNNLWLCYQQMDWGKYNTYLSKFWRNCRHRFGIYNTYRRRSIHPRDNNKGSKSSIISNRSGKRNRHYFYYYIIISILTIGNPVYAEEGDTKNVSNPVAAATGNVTNQAVQFQNNGAPSRQNYGSGISCNGATMTFSPFYMGNHVKPGIPMDADAYTKNENWGGQINFMVPLDGGIQERCKSIAARQEEKMQLNYELVRIDNCAKLQQKGFMLRPGSRVYHLCHDVIPIAAFKNAQKDLKNNPLINYEYDRTNQTSPIRFYQEYSSKATNN